MNTKLLVANLQQASVNNRIKKSDLVEILAKQNLTLDDLSLEQNNSYRDIVEDFINKKYSHILRVELDDKNQLKILPDEKVYQDVEFILRKKGYFPITKNEVITVRSSLVTATRAIKWSKGKVEIDNVVYKAFQNTMTKKWYVVKGEKSDAPRVVSDLRAKSSKDALEQFVAMVEAGEVSIAGTKEDPVWTENKALRELLKGKVQGVKNIIDGPWGITGFVVVFPKFRIQVNVGYDNARNFVYDAFKIIDGKTVDSQQGMKKRADVVRAVTKLLK